MEQKRPEQKRRMTRREWRIRRRLRLLRNWVIFLSACAAVMAVMTNGILWLLPKAQALVAGPKGFEVEQYDGTAYTPDLSDERLVLVNANLPLSGEPAPVLAVADDTTGERLEQEAAEAYRQMAAAAREDGVNLTLVTGWQDEAAREMAFDGWKQNYMDKGCDEAEAESRAATIQPGAASSEQATGYGADILAEDSTEKNTGFARSRAYEWLSAYAAEYGFILRWPEDRQAATGMVYEPWHWRYVGTENARAIRASGLSLEEFLAMVQAEN